MARAAPVADLVDCAQQPSAAAEEWSSVRRPGSSGFQTQLPRPQFVPAMHVEITRAPDPVTLLYTPRRVHFRPQTVPVELPPPTLLPPQQLQPEENPMEDLLRVFKRLNEEAKKRAKYERKHFTPYDSYTDYLINRPSSSSSSSSSGGGARTTAAGSRRR